MPSNRQTLHIGQDNSAVLLFDKWYNFYQFLWCKREIQQAEGLELFLVSNIVDKIQSDRLTQMVQDGDKTLLFFHNIEKEVFF